MLQITLENNIEGVHLCENEAIGWTNTKLDISRSKKYHGLFYENLANLTFFGSAGVFVMNIIDTQGIEATVKIYIAFDTFNGFERFFEGTLNLSKYRKVSRGQNRNAFEVEKSSYFGVKMPIDTTNLGLLLNTYDKIPIDLSRKFSVRNNSPLQSLGQYENFEMYLHSKAIILESIINMGGSVVDFIGTSVSSFFFSVYAQNAETDEIGLNPIIQNITFEGANPTLPFTTIENTDLYEIEIDGLMQTVNGFTNCTQANINLFYEFGSDIPLLPFATLTSTEINADTPSNFTRNLRLILNEGDTLKVYLRIAVECGGGQEMTFDELNVDFDLKLKRLSTEDATPAKNWLIHESLARVLESITEQDNVLISNYYGRLDSSPRAYSGNGCGSLKSLTNGFQIRQFEEGKKPHITLSDLFTSLDAIDCLGLGIEQNGDIEQIRIEERKYFYSDEVVMRFPFVNIEDFNEDCADNYYYNKVNVGYEKFENDSFNSLDEICSKQTRNSFISRISNEYNSLSKLIASGYALEICRREQFKKSASKGNKYDNDNFVICVSKRVKVPVVGFVLNGIDIAKGSVIIEKPSMMTTVELYNCGVNDGTYNPIYLTFRFDLYDRILLFGFPSDDEINLQPDSYAIINVNTYVPEKDENFGVIQNLIDPNSSYNLRISPARNFFRHTSFLNPTLADYVNQSWKFAEGEGNYLASTEMLFGCQNELLDSQLVENQDLTYSITQKEIFKPKYVKFETPCSFEQLQIIKANRKGIIEVSDTDTDFLAGWIEEMNYDIITQKARFTLLFKDNVVVPDVPKNYAKIKMNMANSIRLGSIIEANLAIQDIATGEIIPAVLGDTVIIQYFYIDTWYTETKTVVYVDASNQYIRLNPQYTAFGIMTIGVPLFGRIKINNQNWIEIGQQTPAFYP
ncbi:hypothetical protein V9L05_20615 [Bernardetia sp. Wsw4-3y2]|uniref:hypothetical protein n=1 Tax=Bernardetia sp. Wsw4-3y2 TaxID=3127471 RepID=UPI0030D02702